MKTIEPPRNNSFWLSADLLSWNLLVFAATSLWWTCRLCARKPLFALLLKKNSAHVSVQLTVRSDAMQAFMHGSDWLHLGAPLAHGLMSGMMCWMFLEMIAMTLAMKGYYQIRLNSAQKGVQGSPP